MDQKLRKVFCSSKYEPQTDLAYNIWCVIYLRNKRNTNLKLFAFSLLGLASLIGLVPAIKTLTSEFTQSGFYEYLSFTLSLVFSNTGSIATHWQEFLLSIAESIPVMGIMLSLTLVFVFFMSLKYAMKQVAKNKLSLSF